MSEPIEVDHFHVKVEMARLPCTITVDMHREVTDEELFVIHAYCLKVLDMEGVKSSSSPGGVVKITGRLNPLFDAGALQGSLRYVLNGGEMGHDHS